MSNILTQQQVVDLAIKAGFTPENAQIASAIALCEAPFTIDHVPHANFDAIGDQQLADAKWGFPMELSRSDRFVPTRAPVAGAMS
jgi:hypothetical protein